MCPSCGFCTLLPIYTIRLAKEGWRALGCCRKQPVYVHFETDEQLSSDGFGMEGCPISEVLQPAERNLHEVCHNGRAGRSCSALHWTVCDP